MRRFTVGSSIPVVDLFAGPGGLGEGFASLADARGNPVFRLALSIEKDPVAHRTLSLRSAFRTLQRSGRTAEYYEYIKGNITYETFSSISPVQEALRAGADHAKCAELGKTSIHEIDRWIDTAVSGADDWVLIGGPPCQAYSLAGRSRRANDRSFEKDEKHFLYQEYLRILAKHTPPVFVMENVKGLISATHSGKSMFSRIVSDLASPKKGVRYQIKSFVANDNGLGLCPEDFVIRSERFGVPQRRHRVILLGVREGHFQGENPLLVQSDATTLRDVLHELPRIRSSLSSADSTEAWINAIKRAAKVVSAWRHPLKSQILAGIETAAEQATKIHRTGQKYFPRSKKSVAPPSDILLWLRDPMLDGVVQHQARGHMESDVQRYAFAATFASVAGRSPVLHDFPSALLPAHQNAMDTAAPFADRFRVQLWDLPATTVVSHIAKDGHYYIHPDASQCRSLTVREAARLQTFPDNYFFEGNRTQQYVQVGNAVPPYLALQLAKVIRDMFTSRVISRAAPPFPNAVALEPP